MERVLADGLDAIDLLTADEVMFVAPVRPMALRAAVAADEALPPWALAAAPPPGTASPRVAVLDGSPLANHTLLASRLVIDDPDDRASAYTGDQQHHGTAVASLICHGDLSGPQSGPALDRPVYVRPILQPQTGAPGAVETVVTDELLVDVVHRAFHRIFEGDADDDPSAPSVRIVNLSVGDPARVFVREMSPLARLLDWLVYHYNVLIIISAGNHPPTAQLPPALLNDAARTQEQVVADLLAQARYRKVLAPGEAVNALTIGAVHSDGVTAALPDTVVDVLTPGMPALYTPVGYGYGRSIKPELLAPGGRLVLQRPPPTAQPDVPVELSAAPTAGRGPGLRVAAPAPGGGVTGSGFVHGTSFAAGLVSRAADRVMDILATVDSGPFAIPDAQYHPVLAKALLVHASDWGGARDALRPSDATSQTARRELTQQLGYGVVDLERVGSAMARRATSIGTGTLVDGQRHRYEFPLPPSLRAVVEWRRLTVTLAWFSPVAPGARRHRLARLLMSPPDKGIGVRRTEADHHRVGNGTVRHEILEGAEAVAFADGDVLAVNIDARVDGRGKPPVRYGLAVSLEVATTSRSDIHEEVRQGLVRIRERQQQQIRT